MNINRQVLLLVITIFANLLTISVNAEESDVQFADVEDRDSQVTDFLESQASPPSKESSDIDLSKFDRKARKQFVENQELKRDDLESFDDGDKEFSPEERAILLKHKFSDYYRKADLDKDGKISAIESETYEKKLKKVTQFTAAELDEESGADNSNLSIDRVEFYVFDPPSPELKDSLAGFQIRRKYEDVTVLTDKQGIGNIQGALFSYTDDLENNNNTWKARGAIFRPFVISTNKAGSSKKPLVLTKYSINPGITFDREFNTNPVQNDIDVLTFNLGTELEFSGGNFLNSQYFRANLLYETDFNLNRGIFGGNIQWQPLKLGTGIGHGRRILGGALSYRIRPIIHIEGGTGTIDNGTNESYFRIGPQLKLEVWPSGPFSRFTFTTQYEYYQSLLSGSNSRDLFEAGLSYNIDKNGNVTTDITYRNGQISLDGQDAEEITIGIGIKF